MSQSGCDISLFDSFSRFNLQTTRTQGAGLWEATHYYCCKRRSIYQQSSGQFFWTCVPSQTQGVQWYSGSPSQCDCLASAFHAPRRCAGTTSWSIAIARQSLKGCPYGRRCRPLRVTLVRVAPPYSRACAGYGRGNGGGADESQEFRFRFRCSLFSPLAI